MREMLEKIVFDVNQVFHILDIFPFNPSRPNPERREKIKVNFYFHTSLCCLKNLIFISRQFSKMHGTLSVNVGEELITLDGAD